MRVPGLQFVFISENTVYYKSVAMQRLDEELGDLKFQLVDMETNVMLRLQQRLLVLDGPIRNAVRLMSTLDWSVL